MAAALCNAIMGACFVEAGHYGAASFFYFLAYANFKLAFPLVLK
jgi:hypothetical protein